MYLETKLTNALVKHSEKHRSKMRVINYLYRNQLIDYSAFIALQQEALIYEIFEKKQILERYKHGGLTF